MPKPDAVKLRPESELAHCFKDLPLVDAKPIVTGTAQFGADVKLPGMLFAVIERPPVVGGKVASYDATAALKVRGVKKVVQMPQPEAPWKFQPWSGVAVLADNTWAAMRGRAALKIEWDLGRNATYDSDAYAKELSKVVHEPGKPARNKGDVDTALGKAAKVVEAEYHVPHLAHVPMEPPVAIAHFQDGACEAWAPTQNPQGAMKEMARVLGIEEEKTTCHVTLLGGAFGRKSKADFVSEAAWLSREMNAPVRVQFTREDDLRHDYYNAVNTQLLTAALDQKGKVTAWRQRTALTGDRKRDLRADRPAHPRAAAGPCRHRLIWLHRWIGDCALRRHFRRLSPPIRCGGNVPVAIVFPGRAQAKRQAAPA